MDACSAGGCWPEGWSVVEEIMALAEQREVEVFEALLALCEEQMHLLHSSRVSTQLEMQSLGTAAETCLNYELSHVASEEHVPEDCVAGLSGMFQSMSPGSSSTTAIPLPSSCSGAAGIQASTAHSQHRPEELLRYLREKDQLLGAGLNWRGTELEDAILKLRQARTDPVWELPPYPRNPAINANDVQNPHSQWSLAAPATLESPCNHLAPSARGPVPRVPGSPINVGGPLPPKQLQSKQRCSPGNNDITTCATCCIRCSPKEGDKMQQNNGDNTGFDGDLHVQLKAFFAHCQHRHWQPFLCSLHGCSYLLGSVPVRLRPGPHGWPEASRDQGGTWQG
eukprot:CAMPEP_0172899012 /NCGR_PEP_ID=MMETSP1075-20121228/160862_1 /TAXON_ID=2916 /ORGANISM="Ceratium fusus, Strain PA161109" /LENGTH=337 /DNA_ID=CAMNT_0013754917 /DNA_START=32 /DNA_END=1042 /DNA_ORIENTATION=+